MLGCPPKAPLGHGGDLAQSQGKAESWREEEQGPAEAPLPGLSPLCHLDNQEATPGGGRLTHFC